MPNLALRRTEAQIPISPWLKSQGTGSGSVQISWAGQAGFIIKSSKITVGIDLYLSDSLAEKYKGKEFAHIRMMAPPIPAQECSILDLILCTHGHTDHMDPQTLKPLYAKEGGPLCIGPRFEAQKMADIGVPAQKSVGLNAKEVFSLTEDGKSICTITAIPSAHEEITVDSWGNTKALGYLIELEGIRIYHSGDSLLYEGLVENLKALKPDIALLPVNGRKDHLAAKGIAGNFSVDQACTLAKEAGSSFLIPHHFGMFDFNTVSKDSIASSLQEHKWILGNDTLIPKIGEVYTFQKTTDQ